MRGAAQGRGWATGRWSIAVAALVYLALSVALWWGIWSGHPSTTTTCGCGDAARFLWFFEWPAYALAHGHSVLYSQWLFHPTGINLLDDTSVLAFGIVLAPITLLAGPVVSMNVALTLAPALSALTMFLLLRRWVRWTPSAFVGALAYGFSPFLVAELAYNQLNIATLAIPPLVVMALDELLVRHRRSPVKVGVLLGLAVAVQFFVGVEMLLITAIAAAVAVAMMAVFTAARSPAELRRHVVRAWRGIATACVTAAVLLAYPVWFFFAGPAHLTGPVWSDGAVDRYGSSITSFWSTAGPGSLVDQLHFFGGYQGPALPGFGYLGAGTVVVAVVGTILWRHDRRLLLFGALAVVAAALSLGPHTYGWAPWRLVEKIPQVGNIVEIRFTAVATLCVAVMVAVVIDRVHAWASARYPNRAAVARLAGAVVALAALVPTVVALAPNLPLTTEAVVLPQWFATTGATLPPGRVVLAYPAPFAGNQSSMAWQAVDAMRFAMAGGGGPQGVVAHAGAERAGFEVLFGASLGLGPAPALTPANVAAVRRALRAWQVTTVVVPHQPELPAYDHGRSTAYAVALFTAVLGRPPRYQQSAWVWSSVRAEVVAA